MANIFHVIGTFHITGRTVFFVYGDIVQGVARAGMFARVSRRSAMPMELPVDAVEFVDLANGEFHLALGFKYENEEQLDRWKRLNIGDEDLELIDEKSRFGEPRSEGVSP